MKTLTSRPAAGVAALTRGLSESPASAAPEVCRKARRVFMGCGVVFLCVWGITASGSCADG